MPPSKKSDTQAREVLKGYIGMWPRVAAEYKGLVDMVAMQIDQACREERDLICEDLKARAKENLQYSREEEGAESAMYETIAETLGNLAVRYERDEHKTQV